MLTATIPDDKLFKFVDAGRIPLNSVSFASQDLDLKKRNLITAVTNTVTDDSSEVKSDVKYEINLTGNVIYGLCGSEGSKVSQQTTEMFRAVNVILGAVTTAMRLEKKSLFDYDVWTQLIGRSPFFAEVEKFQQLLVIKESSVSIDLQIINQLLPGILTDRAIRIAKNILGSISGEYSSSKKSTRTKIAHLLVFCEELFGCPDITLRLFYVDQENLEEISKTPCSESASMNIELLQEANTFRFVSPEILAEFGKKYHGIPPKYQQIIADLRSQIKS